MQVVSIHPFIIYVDYCQKVWANSSWLWVKDRVHPGWLGNLLQHSEEHSFAFTFKYMCNLEQPADLQIFGLWSKTGAWWGNSSSHRGSLQTSNTPLGHKDDPGSSCCKLTVLYKCHQGLSIFQYWNINICHFTVHLFYRKSHALLI